MLASSRSSAWSTLQCLRAGGLGLLCRSDARGLEFEASAEDGIRAIVASLVYDRHRPPD